MYIPSLLPPITTPSSIHPSIAYSSATPSLAVSPITAPPPAEQPIESLETSTERRTRKQLDVYTRTQICTLKNIAGWSYSQIQAHFPHIPRSTITTTVKREPSRRNNQTVRRTGAPKKLGEEEKKKLLDALDNDPRITWDDLEKVIDRKAGRHCIRRLFESEGRRKGPPDRKLRHSQKMMAGARGSESDSGPDPNIRPEPDT
ncbi:hypothetical protein N7456_001131 [Penicillium angulare]|uniref:Uncharacterized protein n=1 Tax=Penicillium angulare TaxID=116970 RepID=A0A9W9GEU8_9EURO|nr:hypothetical protein N7456_001131 [Penicillium angulare]